MLSPLLFSFYNNGVVDELRNTGKGVTLGGIWIGILLFADDMALIADTSEDLQILIDGLVRYMEQWRLEIHPGKTKVVVFGG